MVLALLITVLGAELLLEPGAARPGDTVVITVSGASGVPTGRLGLDELTFLPVGTGYRALVGLRVEQRPGLLTLEVTTGDEGTRTRIDGQLQVLPASFRRRALSVSRRFTSPSRAQRQRSQADAAAFSQAFDRDFEPFLSSGPFDWPLRTELTALFGDVRVLNGRKRSQHFGVDLDGAVGDPVAAAHDGEVVLVRDCFASGQTVLVHHGARLFTAYFHLSRLDVQVGQRVRQGQQVGLVGKSGRVTGPHLHFGAHLDGRWVNPAQLLGLRFAPP